MLKFIPKPLVGSFSFLMYLVNTLFWMVPIAVFTVLKLIFPIDRFRTFCNAALDSMATNWISINGVNQRLTGNTKFTVEGTEHLQKNQWCLVVSNHQSWVDILVLQRVFNRKIPFLKFFLKKELIWVPIMGPIWWALDFPFMKRYSRSFIKKNPHLAGKDIEITKKACEKFKKIPVSVMNFVEGTRFTPQKHDDQESPYTFLLKPRAGGIAFVLAAMGEQMHRIINVTIVYPGGIKSFWEFLCGQVDEISVRVDSLPIPGECIGDYFNDREFRENFQVWLNKLWEEKDKIMASM